MDINTSSLGNSDRGEAQGSVEAELSFDPAPILGNVAWLWMQSDLHNEWPVSLLNTSVMPALRRGSFLLMRNDRIPLGFACWTGLSEEAERRYVQKPSSLVEADWDSGDRYWTIDFVAPFGEAVRLGREMRKRVYSLAPVFRSLRVKPDDDTARVSEFFRHDLSMEDREKNREEFRQNLTNSFYNQRISNN